MIVFNKKRSYSIIILIIKHNNFIYKTHIDKLKLKLDIGIIKIE